MIALKFVYAVSVSVSMPMPESLSVAVSVSVYVSVHMSASVFNGTTVVNQAWSFNDVLNFSHKMALSQKFNPDRREEGGGEQVYGRLTVMGSSHTTPSYRTCIPMNSQHIPVTRKILAFFLNRDSRYTFSVKENSCLCMSTQACPPCACPHSPCLYISGGYRY